MSSLAQCHRNAFFLIVRLAANDITWKMPFFSQWRSAPILEYPSIQEGLATGLRLLKMIAQ